MKVVLVMFRPDGQRRSFPVNRDVTVVGRREDCDFRIPLSDVSRKHCRIVKDHENKQLRVEDLGSSNGTFRNGARVQNDVLDPGDTLAVGPVTFVVQIDDEPAEENMQPVLPPKDDLEIPPPQPAKAKDEEDVLSADALESPDDEIARILNADDDVAGSDNSGNALLDLNDSGEQDSKG
jgi:pSer/pThr/pTyr-binding forkhead associated (FHA) protein